MAEKKAFDLKKVLWLAIYGVLVVAATLIVVNFVG